VAQQTKTAVVISGDVTSVAAGIGKIRVANERQAEAVETVTAALTSLRAHASETSSARPTDPA
jgi:methyl-accepting chemotaxis protein